MPEPASVEPPETATPEPMQRPWEELSRIIQTEAPTEAVRFLDSLPAGETARSISRLDHDERIELLSMLTTEQEVQLLEELADPQVTELVEMLPAEEAAAIVGELQSNARADLLAELEPERAEEILAAMAPEEAADARRLGRYEADTAGGLMVSEYLRYENDQTVRDVLGDLRANAEKYSDYDVQYAYVVRAAGTTEGDDGAAAGQLVGVLRLRDLLLSPSHRPIAAIMIDQPLSVPVDAPLDELEQFFDRHHFLGVPAVDSRHRMAGVVRRHDVEEAVASRADATSLKVQGIIGGEELRTMPFRVRAGRRLTWLAANIALNLVAVSVIAMYEETLAAVIALAVFLPMISDMGGNAGVQAIAVSIRELSMGLLRPHELIWVAMKEGSVGIVNGVILGIIVGVVGWVWQQNAALGVVVGAAMALNTVVATVVGGAMPLILSRFDIDPALAAGPILTTITDMSGFFFVLSFATLALSMLV